MKPLYMWAGGKSKVLRHYSEVMPLAVDTYVEPFFGGGAMFIHVMKTYSPRRAVINDINQDIINIYSSIRHDYQEFLTVLNGLEAEYLVKSKPDRKLFYYDVRNQHAWDYESWSQPRESATLYFLMRTGFNGIYQLNQNTNGRYGTPCGLLGHTDSIYNRDVVDWWHQALQTTTIMSGDWRDCCNDIDDGFFFMDPPYRDSFANYGTAFTDADLTDLIDFGSRRTDDIMICNRDSADDWFDQRRGSLDIIRFPVTYTAGRRKRTETGFEAKPAVEVLLYRTRGRPQLFEF